MCSLPQLSAPNLKNLVTITLSSPEDYLLWKTQITCLLLSHQLLGLVDGTAIIPLATVLDEYGNSVPNVHFYEYLRILISKLQSRFMHASMARSIELKGRLTHVKKNESQSMDGYLREIKVIVDSLAAIQCPVSNQDIVQYTLFGLDHDFEYDHIVTTLLHYPFHINFDDLRPKLLLHEQRLKNSRDGSDSSSHHALLAV
ncbi:uncharacterized protein LOC125491719 [Beta vulgaris subsp. vulgaris]|uniref:uncharacterized protein LOC125491719 n=1 Tax=Beta vulgaris subsp. vulgaris TaxID=3555 RepID=UPI002036E0A8|nr:uncharacterized protein LOC125491719 [Beta vulgaris subsp. vulgaris]